MWLDVGVGSLGNLDQDLALTRLALNYVVHKLASLDDFKFTPIFNSKKLRGLLIITCLMITYLSITQPLTHDLKPTVHWRVNIVKS